jgi:hypothetical protein
VIIFIQVFDPAVIELVRDGKVEGDIYADKECWANPISLAWYQEHGTPYHESPEFREVS